MLNLLEIGTYYFCLETKYYLNEVMEFVFSGLVTYSGAYLPLFIR